MLDGWTYNTLDEICSKITDGSHNPPKGLPYPTDFKMISSQNVFNDVLDCSDVRYLSESDFMLEDKRTRIRKGDVLLTIVGTIGRCAVVKGDEGPIALQRSVAVLSPIEDVLPRFLMYALMGNRENLEREGHGIAQKGLYLKQLAKFKIFRPKSIDEQQRIVDELDILTGIIDKKKAQLRDLDALAQSIFYEMFGDPSESKYPVAKLSSLAIGKLSYGSGASAIDFDGQIRYVRITDIQEDGRLSPDAMSPSQFDAKYLLNDGDILLARSGATVGKTYLYDSNDGNAVYAGYLIRFIPNREIVLPEYIYHFTRSHYYKAFIASNAQAVAQPNINAQQYGNLNVCVPPISEQKAFAEKIHFLESKRDMIWSSIKDTQILLYSRMSHYFD